MNFRTRLHMAMVVSLLASLLASRALAADRDVDGVDDVRDNCILAPNPDQRDSNLDGSGNRCDADVDNDGTTISLDVDLFKKAFLGTDADMDLSGDGRVTSADVGLLKNLLFKVPGPSAYALAADPPKVEDLKYFTVPSGELGPEGETGAVTARLTFRPELPQQDVVYYPVNGYLVELRDDGLGIDEGGGDHVYAGRAFVDASAIVANEQSYLSRLAQLPGQPNVTLFSGRHAVGNQAFAPPPPAPLQSSAATTVVALGGGVEGTEVQTTLANEETWPAVARTDHSLMIRSQAVVAQRQVTLPTGETVSLTFDPCNTDHTGNNVDANARWSFKKLLANMIPRSGTQAPSEAQIKDFIHAWLVRWRTNSVVNTFTIPSRPNIVDFFPGWDGVNASSLNVDRLPFRLVSIVNRMDLFKVGAYGGRSETRFVFGLLNIKDTPLTSCTASLSDRMTVILEYRDPITGCRDAQGRAQAWTALSDHALGSPAYFSGLLSLTDFVTEPNRDPTKPNGSALNQLRTNDDAFDGRGGPAGKWELREFVLSGSPAATLQPTSIKRTPDVQYRSEPGDAFTAAFLQNPIIARAVLCDRLSSVPSTWVANGTIRPFLGASIRYEDATRWNPPLTQGGLAFLERTGDGVIDFPNCLELDPLSAAGCTPNSPTGCVSGYTCNAAGLKCVADNGGGDLVVSELRHRFSINACDDCHSGETDTTFVHVDPTTRRLSKFLAGSGTCTGGSCSVSAECGTDGTCDCGTDPTCPAGHCVTGRCSKHGQCGAGGQCSDVGVSDPVRPDVIREFAELERRGQFLAQLSDSDCTGMLQGFVGRQQTLNFVH